MWKMIIGVALVTIFTIGEEGVISKEWSGSVKDTARDEDTN